MARVDKQLGGVAFLDPDWEATSIKAADSSYTEASPRPGSSSTGDDLARSQPQIVGAQSQPIVLIGTRSGGFPGIDASGGGPAYYLDDGVETGANARHHRHAGFITDARSFGADSTGINTITTCQLSGKVVTAPLVDESTLVAVWVWDPATDAWATTGNVPTTQGALTCVPGTNRLLWVDDAGSTYYSDDDGASWVLMAEYVAFEGDVYAHTNSPRHLAWDGQGQLLWVGLRDDASDIADFRVSSDGGLSWEATGTLTDCRHVAISAHPSGSILVVYSDSVTDQVESFVLSGASEDPQIPTVVTIDDITSLEVPYGVGVCVDEDGAAFAFYRLRIASGNNRIRWTVSYDAGQSWVSRAERTLLSSDVIVDSLNGRDALTATASMGSVWLLVGSDTGADSTVVLRLGGWQGPYMEIDDPGARAIENRLPVYAGDTSYHRGAMMIPSFPFYGSVITRTSGSVLTETDGGLTFTLGPSTAEYVSWGHSLVLSYDAFARYAIAVSDDDGSSTGVRLELDSNTRHFAVYHKQDAIGIVDIDGATSVEAAITDGAKVHVEVFFDDSEGTVTVLYRDTAADPGGTKWSTLTHTLTGTHTAAATQDFSFGVPANTTTSASYTVFYMHALGVFTSSSLGASPINPPSALSSRAGWGKAIGPYAYPVPDVYAADSDRVGRLVMRGGPLVRHETYTHDVAPDFPVEVVFPTVDSSPDSRWRSTADDTTQNIAVTLDAQDGLVAGARSLLVLLHRSNFRRLRVDGKTASGSYVTLGTVDLASGFVDCSFSRTGSTISPDSPYTGTTGARYIHPGELRGGHVILDPAGTPVVRKIKTNTGGMWGGASAVQASIILEAVDGTEPSSGDVHIVSPSGVLALHFDAAGAPFADLRFTVDATEVTAEGYFEAGVIAPFGLRPTGKPWADGWEWEHTPNVRQSVDSARTERRKSLGAARASVSLSWDDGFTLARTRGGDPDYIADATVDQPLVARDDVWRTLVEWLELTDGTARPVVWCGAVPGDGVTITDPTLWLYGYLQPQGIRAQQAKGTEGVDEFMRGSGIRIVEAV